MKHVALLLLCLAPLACGSEQSFDPDRADESTGDHRLAKIRAQITFPTTTPEQRQLLADQIDRLVNEAHVNLREYRNSGDDNGVFTKRGDPTPALAALVDRAQSLTDEQFQLATQLVFKQSRDLHFSFDFPKPHNCYTMFLPFELEDRFTPSLKPQVTVIRKEELLIQGDKELDDLQARVLVGDVLVSYGGKPIEALLADRPLIDIADALERDDHAAIAKAMENVNTLGQGANLEARRNRALRVLRFRPGNRFPVPADDDVELRLRHKDGSEDTLTFPWLVRITPGCLPTPTPPADPVTASGKSDSASDGYSADYNAFVGAAGAGDAAATGAVVFDVPVDPARGWGWGHIEVEPGVTIGYIRLTSFTPKVPMTDGKVTGHIPTVVAFFADEILRPLREQHHVVGLIFDVRNNPGGNLTFADSLVQLVSRHPVDPLHYRLRNSDFNRTFLGALPATGNHSFDPFIADLEPLAGSKKVFGGGFPISPASVADANSIGQRFYGPVAVLTNAACYSSCDAFAALIQDMEAGKLYGVDNATGAGGANVLAYANFQNLDVNDILPPIDTLFRIPYRQILRVRDNEGTTLEQTGVLVDQRFVPFAADLAVTDPVLDKVVSDLLARPAGPGVDIERYVVRVDPAADQVTLPVHTTGGIDLVRAFAGDQLVGSVDIRDLLDNPSVDYDTPDSVKMTLGRRGFVRYRVEGVRQQARAFSAVFELRRALAPRPAGDIDLAADLSLVTRSHDDPAIGWQLNAAGELVAFESGDEYPFSLDTLAEVQIQPPSPMPAKLALHMTATGKTEAGFDFLHVIVRDQQERVLARKALDGDIAVDGELIDLTEFLASGPVTIQLLFVSDGADGDIGVRIQKLAVK